MLGSETHAWSCAPLLLVPFLRSLASLRGRSVLSVRAEYTDPTDELELRSGDEVAVIPPISGG